MKPERLSRTTVYESPWVNLYLDEVRFANGHVIEKYHLLDFPHPAVAILVENEFGSLVFAQISRYTTGLTEWELPAGGVEFGETEIEAAKREVLEETGYTTKDHQLLYSYYPMNGSCNKLFHIVQCRAVERVQGFDENEVSATKWFTPDEVRRMVKSRSFSDGPTVMALLLWLHGES